MTTRKLYYGDNLDVLRRYVKDESVDLVYLDPPFKSGKDYNVLFKGAGGKSSAQVQAFEDTWHWGEESESALADLARVKPGAPVTVALLALRKFLGESDMMAYLCMMAPRLVELRRVLKDTGSLFLHCDPTASHYLKVLLDAVFGDGCFRNEVIWRYRRWPTKSKQFQKMHDVLLFYSRSSEGGHQFETLYGYEKLADSTLKTFGTKKQKADFSQGHRKPSTMEEETQGPPLSDVWEVGVLAPQSKERLGYPTQKPEALLERVIKATTREGDVVLDPFCGCGTAVAVAENLKRSWLGIDVTHLAINLVRRRLEDVHGADLKYEVIGEPRDVEDARALAQQDRFQFQFWCLGLVGARPEKSEEKRGKDRGIDGRLHFTDGSSKEPREIVISVKSGGPKVADVRDLRGVIDREKAAIGVLLLLEKPTRDMMKEAASVGFFDSPWGSFPRLQLLTVEDALKGRGIKYPAPGLSNVTFKKSVPPAKKASGQQSLPFSSPPPSQGGPRKAVPRPSATEWSGARRRRTG